MPSPCGRASTTASPCPAPQGSTSTLSDLRKPAVPPRSSHVRTAAACPAKEFRGCVTNPSCHAVPAPLPFQRSIFRHNTIYGNQPCSASVLQPCQHCCHAPCALPQEKKSFILELSVQSCSVLTPTSFPLVPSPCGTSTPSSELGLKFVPVLLCEFHHQLQAAVDACLARRPFYASNESCYEHCQQDSK